jgi:GR25 family glycosyltransferase involved in LPS biosynthesis
MKLLDKFDKIYCINLDKRKDRWEECVVQFNKIGILDEVERFPAVEHEMGITGCTLSHYEIIKKCKEDGHKNVLVFEDDIKFHDVDNFHKLLESSLYQASKHDSRYDMFYLGGNLKGSSNVRVDENLVRLDNVKTTHAYAISDTIYDVFIDAIEGIDDIDNPFYWAGPEKMVTNPNRYNVDYWYSQNIHPLYKVYGVFPMLCSQRAGHSNISNNFQDYQLKIKWDKMSCDNK